MRKIILARSLKAPSDHTVKRILVRCPSTARLSPTGQVVKEAMWSETKLELPSVVCPHCGQVHTWTKKDVVLAR